MGNKRWRYLAVLICIAALFLPQMVRAEETVIQSGDRVLLINRNDAMALSPEKKRFGLAGAPWDEERFDENAVWTALWQTDGSWIFENASGRLSMDAATLELGLNGAYDRWELTEGEEAVILTNFHSGWTLYWHSGQQLFDVTQRETAQSQLLVHRIPEETPTEPTTEPITPALTETTVPATDATEPQPPGEPAPDMGPWQFYFGQLHAHTADSDGMGTVEDAFSHAANVAGLDFFAVTDHSDSFDNDDQGNLLTDGSTVSQVWAKGKAAARAATNEEFVAMYGFEMSWNQGQGHMSTFRTPGFLSRDQDDYKLYRDGMEAYFDALLDVPESVSQFNHPGTVYGDFKAFSAYRPELDSVISLIEVGSGAGSEYRTAYDAYIQALDAGCHLAPTNNQNNHEGDFGTAGTGRTVVLAENLTEQALFDAMKARRVYATEDADLQIYYALDGAVMGSVLHRNQVGERADLTVKLYDPTDALGMVEVIGPGGKVCATAEASAALSFSLPSDAAYYFVRLTQPDGDIAVTAPVWIRQKNNFRISVFSTATELTRAGEPQEICLELLNNESEAVSLTKLTVTDEAGSVLAEFGEETVAPYGTWRASFWHTFPVDGVQNLTATAEVAFLGERETLTAQLEIPVLPMALTGDILVDGTHGQCSSYKELTAMASKQNLSLRVESAAVTASQLEDCRLLVIPTPERELENGFLELVRNYVVSGGNLLLLGRAGGCEALNTLLEALGSGLRLETDAVVDPVSNGGSPEQIFTAQIAESDWTAGITEGQVFAHIGGCSVTGGQWLVKTGEDTVLVACEEGIFVSGSDFLLDEYLWVSDNPWALPFANRTLAENLLGITRTEPETVPIAQVRRSKTGRIYPVEGLVTAGTHNVNTDFPDSIYIQDASGAIEARGYAAHGLELGRRVRILGTLEREAGRPVLRILQITVGEKETPPLPETVEDMPDYSQKGDQLLKIEGLVTAAETGPEGLRSFALRTGDTQCLVWVEEYIQSGSLGRNILASFVKPGNRVSAVGFCHLREDATVLRVRDCDEVVLTWAPPPADTESVTEPEQPTSEETEAPTMEPPETTLPAEPETSAPAWPDNPPTGDTVFPGRLLAVAMLCLVLGICLWKYE